MPDGEDLFHVRWQTAAPGVHPEPKIPTGGATKTGTPQESGKHTGLYVKDFHKI